MSTSVDIVATTPAGPSRIETEATLQGRQPAHNETVDGLDPDDVARAARQVIAHAAIGNGWFAAPVLMVRRALEQAKSGMAQKGSLKAHGALAATPVAQTIGEAAHGAPESQGGGVAPQTDRVPVAGAHADEGMTARCDRTAVTPMSANERSGNRNEQFGSHAREGDTSAEFREAARRRPRRSSSSADIDVRAVRAGTKLSQPAFAKTFGVPLATLRDWEQGRAMPDGAARTLLRVIDLQPKAVRAAVAAL